MNKTSDVRGKRVAFGDATEAVSQRKVLTTAPVEMIHHTDPQPPATELPDELSQLRSAMAASLSEAKQLCFDESELAKAISESLAEEARAKWLDEEESLRLLKESNPAKSSHEHRLE